MIDPIRVMVIRINSGEFQVLKTNPETGKLDIELVFSSEFSAEMYADFLRDQIYEG